MSTDTEATPTWSFTMTHESYYWDGIRTDRSPVAEIMIQHLDETGGCVWEFPVRWTLVGGHPYEKLVPQVRLFDESWAAFTEIPEVFEFLSEQARTFGGDRHESAPCSPEHLADFLFNLGFVDDTKRVDPNPPVVFLTAEERLAKVRSALLDLLDETSDPSDDRWSDARRQAYEALEEVT